MDIARHPAATRGAPALAGNSLATSETSNPSLQSPTSTPPADPDHSQANLGVPQSRPAATLPGGFLLVSYMSAHFTSLSSLFRFRLLCTNVDVICHR
ncbi:hypothetical protein HBI56_061150 [Parastagonospora nodorum]|nr:hypothetical protein HBH52_172460 [Parastagonospora nodorum]KAH4002300.1 hypothetical protein HBI10_074010 [Parastagonospora nodorum]KAH4017940.1 hypothetical protein HBI13_137120 [Parastagonospora nodorum]KAH4036178.1 hypothetical protein HBI09_083740 [Parastagonospora nodorum]KAH4050367.1 hypothetical protein HBH49_131590 [Parastagonospora nodorum]